MSPTVEQIGEADVPEVVETLAQAFHAVPIIRWAIPDDAVRAEILPDFFAAMVEAYLPWGQIFRSTDGSAAAVWAPPGAQMTAERSAVLQERGAAAMGEYGATFAGLQPLLEPWHPAEPHHYLHFLAVRPEVQGRGYGSTLLRAVLDGADAEGVPAYLDATSEDNKRLYERHNFVVRQEVTLRDSPPLWCMLREAQG
jgi:ribosomal protein S18 acetylase RimI-like enzyme